MKKYSDIFSKLIPAVTTTGRRISIILVLTALALMAFAQEPYVFIEGSVHSFRVGAGNPESTLAWGMYINPYTGIPMPHGTYEIINGGEAPDVTVRFNDMNRASAELCYLVVEETAPNGCSTKRALQILLEPNNMYLEFASAGTEDCYAMGDYFAPLRVGINFLDKAAGVPIPESRFPLNLLYEVRNITDETPAVPGNGGNPMVIEYLAENDYHLLVTEAVGQPNRTIEYELTITSVRDKYDAEITNNSGDIRLQIRVINHLPQSGNMDMALAYVITGIEYLGGN